MPDKLNNVDIVAYALYLRGGSVRAVDTEEVAACCWELFPERFSWAKFPQYPDKNAVQKRLYDARNENHGRLVRGNDKGGWRLTSAGVDRARKVEALAQQPEVLMESHLSDHQENQRFLNELEKHPAFQTFAGVGNCNDLQWYQFTDFLRCLVDTPPSTLKERLESYRARAHAAERNLILSFLSCCENRFHDRLN